MKTYKKYLYGFISIIALIHLSGCMHVLNITETSALQMGSPLRSVESKTFALKDFKNVNDPVLIMERGGHKYIFDQPPATIVTIWLKKELERNGHICVMDSPMIKADFVLEGNVYKFSYTAGGSFTNTSIDIGVKMSISRVATNKASFVKNYEGTFSGSSSKILWKDSAKDAFDQALLYMIKEISTDLELIEFIKK
jgi:hypothetical protein